MCGQVYDEILKFDSQINNVDSHTFAKNDYYNKKAGAR